MRPNFSPRALRSGRTRDASTTSARDSWTGGGRQAHRRFHAGAQELEWLDGHVVAAENKTSHEQGAVAPRAVRGSAFDSAYEGGISPLATLRVQGPPVAAAIRSAASPTSGKRPHSPGSMAPTPGVNDVTQKLDCTPSPSRSAEAIATYQGPVGTGIVAPDLGGAGTASPGPPATTR
jgi:hypothetical protein